MQLVGRSSGIHSGFTISTNIDFHTLKNTLIVGHKIYLFDSTYSLYPEQVPPFSEPRVSRTEQVPEQLARSDSGQSAWRLKHNHS